MHPLLKKPGVYDDACKRMPKDVLNLIEAAYEVDRGEDEWVRGILDAAEPVLASDLGIGAYLYDMSTTPIRTWCHSVNGVLPRAALIQGCQTFDEDYRRANWLSRRFGSLSEFPELIPKVETTRRFAEMGIRDVLAVNALDPSGLGFWVVAPSSMPKLPTATDRSRWSRVAAHLASAVRLRSRLVQKTRPEDADAVLSPRGKVEDARGDAATTEARRSLSDAAAAVERARGPMRVRDCDGAIASWPALVRARWTLVDHFERDGRRYVLAYTNTGTQAEPKVLSQREREVLDRALLGHENKLIAYELGLAASTVRVLIQRAAIKLLTRTRADTLAAYARIRQPPST